LLASTLDNGRGKSRLNLLKHRHERASGVTSSVAHELLGYQDREPQVVNYAHDNVESWTDVHNAAEGGRLVLLTDSAGHPRFRRTIVRSLVAWQPHWILCCIAAEYGESAAFMTNTQPRSISNDEPGIAQGLAVAHLDLCLKLDLPLAVIITKYDLARKQGLKQILSGILDSLKASRRTPHFLRPSNAISTDDSLQTIPHEEKRELHDILCKAEDPAKLVPIILTSAVTGAGITKLHALLRQLPIINAADQKKTLSPRSWTSTDEHSAKVLFDIDEIFAKNIHSSQPGRMNSPSQTLVLSGLLHRGSLNIGDEILLGPFSEPGWASEPRPPLDGRRAVSYPITEHEMAMRRAIRPGPRRRRSSEDVNTDRPSITRGSSRVDDDDPDPTCQEWYNVRVVSIRNLRLPVQTAYEGQAVTIGVACNLEHAQDLRPRKGMVLMRPSNGVLLQNEISYSTACSAFQVTFGSEAYDSMEPGARFFVYVASIRAQVKVINVGLLNANESDVGGPIREGDTEEDVFHLDTATDITNTNSNLVKVHVSRPPDEQPRKIEVMFQLLNCREYIETGAKALVLPEQAGDNGTGLDGFAGVVSAVYV